MGRTEQQYLSIEDEGEHEIDDKGDDKRKEQVSKPSY